MIEAKYKKGDYIEIKSVDELLKNKIKYLLNTGINERTLGLIRKVSALKCNKAYKISDICYQCKYIYLQNGIALSFNEVEKINKPTKGK